MATDWELLQRFAEERDQGAFAELVQAHIGFVHAAACRILGAQEQDAEDVTQAVFLLLSRKAAKIPRRGSLAGWLFLATRWCCAEVKRAQGRRRKHEREAAMNRPDAQVAPEDIRPLLDDALARLGEKERQAILVRYLEGKTAAETGAVLGVSAEAVEKRLERGLGKLRAVFARQGVVVPAAGVAGVMLAESAKAAPAGLGVSVASVAGGAASAGAVTIAKGAAVMMKMALVKVAAVVVSVALLVGAVAGVVITAGGGAVKPVVGTMPAPGVDPHESMASTQTANDFIRGTVEDSNGKPVEGAEVARATSDDTGGSKIEARTRTDAGGRFTLPVQAARAARFSAGGIFAFTRGVGISLPASPTDESPVLRLAPAADIRLTLLAPDATPAAGIMVKPLQIQFQATTNFGPFLRLPKEISDDFSQKTDAAGSCVVRGLPRSASVWFGIGDTRYARLSIQQELLIAGTGPVLASKPIRLLRAASITGKVINPETHQPIVGMEINAQEFDDDVDGAGGRAVTDARGQYVIDRLRPARYVVSMGNRDEERGEWAAAASDVKLVEGEHAKCDLDLTRGGFLKGQVREAGTGKPIQGATVGLYGPGRPNHAAAIYSRTTDAQGRYSFRVAPGRQQPYLAAEIDGYRGSKMLGDPEVREGTTAEVDFEVQPDPTPIIRGIVLGQDDKPVAGATVTCEGDSWLSIRPVQSDRDGHFEIRAAKGARLRARYRDLATVEPAPASDGDDAPPIELRLQTDATFTVVAHLIDEDGKPATDATCTLVVMSGNSGIARTGAPTDGQGIVRFEKLPLDGTYTVEGQGTKYGVSQEQVENPLAEATREAMVTLVLHKLTAQIAGIVVDESGKPLKGITVGINGASTGSKETHTDAGGRFTFPVPEDADALVFIRISGLRILKPIDAQAGQTDLKLVYRLADEFPRPGKRQH